METDYRNKLWLEIEAKLDDGTHVVKVYTDYNGHPHKFVYNEKGEVVAVG